MATLICSSKFVNDLAVNVVVWRMNHAFGLWPHGCPMALRNQLKRSTATTALEAPMPLPRLPMLAQRGTAPWAVHSGSGAIRSGISERVFASLPQESERSGESGGGKKVGSATLLDAAHEYGVSRDRSCREQLAGAAGQRKPAWAGKLDRGIDWALSSRRKTGIRIEESWLQ